VGLAAGIQLLEHCGLVPTIMRDVAGLSPLATIIGLITGFELPGVAGALLAVPMVAALEIAVSELAASLGSGRRSRRAPAPRTSSGARPARGPAQRHEDQPPHEHDPAR
jgi:predicted PurR-regulated permease PerM